MIKPTNPLMTITKSEEDEHDPWRRIKNEPDDNLHRQQSATIRNSSSVQTLLTENETLQPSDYSYYDRVSSNTPSTSTTTVVTTTVPSRVVTIDIITDKASTQALVKTSTETDQWFLDVDQIVVSEAEREGLFLFSHMKYALQSVQHQTSVKRRYSDFDWLFTVLLKRYAFRVIPDLPPKRFSKSKY